MGLFLQIVGGFIIAILLLVFTVYLYFKIKFGKYLSLNAQQEQAPLAVHLNESFSLKWMDDKKVAQMVREVEQQGFKIGKSYSVPEMPNVQLTAFFNPPFIAVLYHHKIAGVWVDICFQKKAGEEVTVSNAPLGEAAERRPEKKMIYMKGASIIELCRHADSLLDQGTEYEAITLDDFREYFEAIYKKDMAYKARNGGISFEEFIKHSMESGIKISDEAVRKGFVLTKLQELRQWEDAVLNGLKKPAQDEDEDSYSSPHFIVPVSTDAQAFIEYLVEKGFVDDDEKQGLDKIFKNETDIFNLFNTLNEGKSPEFRASFIKETDYPIKLKVYQYSYL